MKYNTKLLVIAVATLISVQAFAAFEVSGWAAADMAYEYMVYDAKPEAGKKNYQQFGIPSEDTFGTPSDDTALVFNMAASDGKLSSECALRMNNSGVAVEKGWVAYDFGLTTFKYSAVGLNHRWNEDMWFFDGADGCAFDLTIADIGFFTIMGLESEASGGMQETNKRLLPVLSLGLDVKSDLFSAAIGGVLDINPASNTEKSSDSNSDSYQSDKYTGYMGFVNANADLNPFSITGAFTYGRAIGTVTNSEELKGKDSIGMGILVGIAFTMGQIEIGNTFYTTLAQKAANNNGKNVSGMTPVDAYVQYNIDNNFYVMPYVTVSKYSKENNKSESYLDTIAAVRVGFAW